MSDNSSPTTCKYSDKAVCGICGDDWRHYFDHHRDENIPMKFSPFIGCNKKGCGRLYCKEHFQIAIMDSEDMREFYCMSCSSSHQQY